MRLSGLGIFISTSAGNNGVNTDNNPQYPSAYSSSALRRHVRRSHRPHRRHLDPLQLRAPPQSKFAATRGVNLVGLGLAGNLKEETGSSMLSTSDLTELRLPSFTPGAMENFKPHPIHTNYCC